MLQDFRKNIEKMPVGVVFTTQEVMGDAKNAASANRLLGMMVDDGTLRRAGKGRFYKPEQTEFGILPVNTYELVKDLLVKNGTTIAYISGLNAMNELGITTQVPADITLAYSTEKKSIVRNGVHIRFIRQPNPITKVIIPLLRLLDCLRFLKKAPDVSSNDVIKRVVYLMNELTENQRNKMVRLANKYTPSVRALLGAIMEAYFPQIEVTMLRKSLNDLTKYPLGISDEVLPNQSKWNIV